MALSGKKLEAAHLLAQGVPRRTVAKKVGVARQTIYSWLENPEFTTELDKLTGIIADTRELELRANANMATQVIADIMHKSKSDAVRLRAALESLDRAPHHVPPEPTTGHTVTMTDLVGDDPEAQMLMAAHLFRQMQARNGIEPVQAPEPAPTPQPPPTEPEPAPEPRQSAELDPELYALYFGASTRPTTGKVTDLIQWIEGEPAAGGTMDD